MAPVPSKVKSSPSTPLNDSTSSNPNKASSKNASTTTHPSTNTTTSSAVGQGKIAGAQKQQKKQPQATNPFLVGLSVFIIVAAFGVFKWLEPLEAYGTMNILNNYFFDKQFEGVGTNVEVTFQRTSLMNAAPKTTLNENGEETDTTTTSATIPTSNKPGSIDLRYPKVTTKRAIKAKTPLMTIPRSEVIDVQAILRSPIAKLIGYDNSTHVTALGDMSFQTIFYFAFYMMYERRRGTESPHYGWIASLPASFEHEGGALYWPDHVANCLDRMAAAEYVAVKSIVGTTAQAANACCELPREAIVGSTVCEAIADGKAEPFTEEEAKWGMSVYLRYNYNDQAILPGLNFFKRSNKKEGVFVKQSTKGEQSYEVISLKDMEEGEEPVWNYVRGPGSSLVLYGFFDNTTASAEFPFRLPQVDRNSLIHRMCHDEQHNLLFNADGKPKEQLVRCMGALLAQTSGQKKNLNNLRTREPLFLIDIYGNLTVVVHRHGTSIINASQSEHCSVDGLNDKDEAMVLDYIQYSNKFFNKITQYLFEETDRMCIANKIPSRLRAPKKAEFSEEEEAAQKEATAEAYEEFANTADEDVEDGMPQDDQ